MSPMDLLSSCVTGEILTANHAVRFSPHAEVARAKAKLQRRGPAGMRQCAGVSLDLLGAGSARFA
jgi:hypothetical protein